MKKVLLSIALVLVGQSLMSMPPAPALFEAVSANNADEVLKLLRNGNHTNVVYCSLTPLDSARLNQRRMQAQLDQAQTNFTNINETLRLNPGLNNSDIQNDKTTLEQARRALERAQKEYDLNGKIINMLLDHGAKTHHDLLREAKKHSDDNMSVKSKPVSVK